MNRQDEYFLLYVETRCVDYRGILEDVQMNADDLLSLESFKLSGLLEHKLREDTRIRGKNTVVRLTERGWLEAHKLRRERAARMLTSEIWGEELKESPTGSIAVQEISDAPN